MYLILIIAKPYLILNGARDAMIPHEGILGGSGAVDIVIILLVKIVLAAGVHILGFIE